MFYTIFIISIFIFNPVNIRIIINGSPAKQSKITYPRDERSSGNCRHMIILSKLVSKK
jgi:hypothetical protein